MSVEVMKQALEALEYFDGEYDVKDEITALRAAIAEASMQRLTDVQQEIEHSGGANKMGEPIAYLCKHTGWFRKAEDADAAFKVDAVPLYEASSREWVGLTDDEIRLFSSWLDEKMDAEVFAGIEAKLKEKNHD